MPHNNKLEESDYQVDKLTAPLHTKEINYIMKKIFMAVIGSLLFMAGYDYTRRQAEYTATQSAPVKSAFTKTSGTSFLKALPVFVFRTNKAAFTNYHL